MSRAFAVDHSILVQLVITVFLLSTDVRAASVNILGTTAIAVEKESYIDLDCTYTLEVNETATRLVWEKVSGSNIGNVLTWDIAGGGAATPVAPWTLDTSSGATSANARLPAASTLSARAGSYKCSLIHEPGGVTVEESRNIVVQYAPQVRLRPSGTEFVNEGTPLTITCSVNAIPKATLTWTVPSGVPSSTEAKLVVPTITRSQGGSYTCTATNRLTPSVGDSETQSTSATTEVVVRYVDSPKLNLSKSMIRENDTVTFMCATTSSPTANLSIIEPDGKVMTSSITPSVSMTKKMGCLDDSGSYICHAATTYSETWFRDKKTVKVMCKPRKDPRKIVVTTFTPRLNQTVMITAYMVGYPSPTLQWMKQEPGSDQLTPLVSTSDQQYVVVNDDSRLKSTLSVRVQSTDDFTQYFLKAKNQEGEATLQYVLTSRLPPSKLTELEIVNSTTDSITITWRSKYNGGLAQNYFVQYRLAAEGDEAWTELTTPLPDPGRERSAVATINNILPGRDYTVRVYSKNTLGSSPFSDSVSARTTDPPSPLHFGIGIVIGIIITVVVAGVAIGIFVLIRRRKSKDKTETTDQGPNYENHVFNAEAATGSTYASLNGIREKPSTSNYDSFTQPNPTYMNLGEATAAEATSPELYMNYKPPGLDPQTNGTPRGATAGVYENTNLNKRPGKVKGKKAR